MSLSTTSKLARVTADTALIAGLTKHKPDLPATFIVNGETVTSDKCVTVLQGRLATLNAIAPARAALSKAVAADRLEQTETDPFILALRGWITATFANAPDILADFGIVPKKKTGAKTPAVKVVAAAKSAETRKLRHTVGPKAKAQIKSTLTGPVVVESGPQPLPAQAALAVATVRATEGPGNGSPK